MSEAPPNRGELELDDDIDFQRRSWKFQRAGRFLMALLVVLALLGLFGGGPLSNATAGGEGAKLSIEYSRFARLSGTSTLRLRLAPGAATGGEAKIRISREFLDGVQVDTITPEPTESEAGEEHTIFTFAIPDATQPAIIEFHFRPLKFGRLSADVGLVGETRVRLAPLVYP